MSRRPPCAAPRRRRPRPAPRRVPGRAPGCRRPARGRGSAQHVGLTATAARTASVTAGSASDPSSCGPPGAAGWAGQLEGHRADCPARSCRPSRARRPAAPGARGPRGRAWVPAGQRLGGREGGQAVRPPAFRVARPSHWSSRGAVRPVARGRPPPPRRGGRPRNEERALLRASSTGHGASVLGPRGDAPRSAGVGEAVVVGEAGVGNVCVRTDRPYRGSPPGACRPGPGGRRLTDFSAIY